MRTIQDINKFQCDKCGKIQQETPDCCDIEGEWEGLCLCDKCYEELKK